MDQAEKVKVLTGAMDQADETSRFEREWSTASEKLKLVFVEDQ